jgi:hypothetical protein
MALMVDVLIDPDATKSGERDTTPAPAQSVEKQ